MARPAGRGGDREHVCHLAGGGHESPASGEAAEPVGDIPGRRDALSGTFKPGEEVAATALSPR